MHLRILTLLEMNLVVFFMGFRGSKALFQHLKPLNSPPDSSRAGAKTLKCTPPPLNLS